MLKYTLGALAAAVILLGAGFVVLVQVTDGGANQRPARPVIVEVWDDGVWPPVAEIGQNEVVELQLQNKSTVVRAASLEGEGVEQLAEAPGAHEAAPTRSQPFISVESGPGLVDDALVRFREKGEYTLRVYTPGVYLSSYTVKVLVK